MDVLSDVIPVVRLSGAVFFTAEFSSPWALESPNPDLLADIVMPDAECVVLFHILMDGACIVQCAGCAPARLGAHDVIVFPHGEPHLMRSDEDAQVTRMDSVFPRRPERALPQVTFGGGGRTSRFICGYLNCDQRFAPLLSALPTMLVVRSRNEHTSIEAIDRSGRRPTGPSVASTTWLGTTLRHTIDEARTARPGSAAMLGRLTELMFVEIIREYMQQLPEHQGGWLAGLQDPHVGKALRLLHASPMRSWTVERAGTPDSTVAVGAGAALHGPVGRGSDALSRELADAIGQRDGAGRRLQHPGDRHTRWIRIGACLQPCVQARDRIPARCLAQGCGECVADDSPDQPSRPASVRIDSSATVIVTPRCPARMGQHEQQMNDYSSIANP